MLKNFEINDLIVITTVWGNKQLKTKYRFKDYTFGQLKNDIIMPDFQRSLVWSKEQKKEFIQNAIEGNPFGILLLYDDLRTG